MSEHHLERGASVVVLALALAAIGCSTSAGTDAAPFEGSRSVDHTSAADTQDASASSSQDAAAPSGADDSAQPDNSKTDDAAPAADNAPADGDAQRADATYEVPVEAALTSFATYPVSHVKWDVKKGQRVLEYNLPDDLVGTSNKIELSGTDVADNWQLTGNAGTASCSTHSDQISCQESLPGITVDVGAIQTRVDLGQLAQEKLAVTKVFQGDPLGVLQFKPR